MAFVRLIQKPHWHKVPIDELILHALLHPEQYVDVITTTKDGWMWTVKESKTVDPPEPVDGMFMTWLLLTAPNELLFR